MGRKRKLDCPPRMMSDVVRTRISEEPLVPPSHVPSTLQPSLTRLMPLTQPPALARTSHVTTSRSGSSSSQPTSGSSSVSSTKSGRGCARGIKEWGSNTRFDVQFDNDHNPVGPNATKLSSQLGVLVRNGNRVPLTFLDWTEVPEVIIDIIWNDVKANLVTCPEGYKPLCIKTCNNIWKDHKSKIKTKYFKPFISDPNLRDKCPPQIVSDQWKELVDYWRSKDAEEIAVRNAENRRARGVPHTTGRIPFSHIRHEMTDNRQATDKMSVWAMTRRATDPDVIQILDEFDRQLSMLPEEGRTTEAKDAIFHDLVGKDGHGYCLTYGKTKPWRAVYGGEVGPSQSVPQAPTIAEITQQVRAELRDELKEEMRAEFTAQLEQMRAEMLTLMSHGENIDPNRQVPDASSSMQLNWSSRT